jgi:phospholipid transport system substrate-binding protein
MRKLSLLSLLIFFIIQSSFADESPLQIIKLRNQKVKEILDTAGEKVAEKTKEELKEIINGIIDFQQLSRMALGKYWDERTEAERKEFVDVFQQLIRNSSVKKLEVYKADKIVYEDPEINGDKAEIITLAYKDRKEAEIIYKMHKPAGEWKVYDIEIDGVSTALNYRESFYKQIAKTSYTEMFDKLVERLEEE